MEHIFEGGIIGRSNDERGDAFMRSMIGYEEQRRRNAQECASRLRALGVKLATPDDGWVDREKNTVMPPSYVMFDEGPAAGDKIALGSPTCDANPIGAFRLVEVTKVTKMLFGGIRYDFKPTGEWMTFQPC